MRRGIAGSTIRATTCPPNRPASSGASLAAAQGDPARATRLVGAVDAERTKFGGGVAPATGARREPWLQLTRQALGAEAVADALAAGQAMTLEPAVDDARDEERTSPVSRGI
jgi:hypothetical protein